MNCSLGVALEVEGSIERGSELVLKYVILKALFRKGPWEPFIGLGISSNIRVFAREREEAEGKRVQYSAGTLVPSMARLRPKR